MRKVQVAVIGCGRMGRRQVKWLAANPAVKRVVGVEPDAANAARARAECGIEVHADPAAVLGDPAISAVTICSPNHLHAGLALRALAAGRHVMCEKPMALHARDGRALVTAAAKAGKILHVGFELRNSLVPKAVKRLVKGGAVGKVTAIHFLHARPPFFPHWKGNPSLSGGPYLMETCHMVDLWRWWLEDEVVEVSAIGGGRVVPHYRFPDTIFTTWRFAKGAVAHDTLLHRRTALPRDFSRMSRAEIHDLKNGWQYEVSLMGTRGSLFVRAEEGKISVYRHEPQPNGEFWQRLVREIDFTGADHLEQFHDVESELRIFVRAVVAGRRATHLTPRDALGTHLACFAAMKSLFREGRPVRVPSTRGNR